MDLAMDISAAVHEVVQKKPGISTVEAIGSGLAVGRAVSGTMVTTLLLAYAGGYMAMLMLFMGQGIPPIDMININYVAAEIMRTIVGSFGLVAVAPFTAVVAGLIYVPRTGRWFPSHPFDTRAYRSKLAGRQPRVTQGG